MLRLFVIKLFFFGTILANTIALAIPNSFADLVEELIPSVVSIASTTIVKNQNNQNIKELPHNLEAEQALLGAILLNNDILYDINEIIDANHFFESIHIKIFEVINKIAAKGQLATPITLKSYFEVEKNLEDIGGSAYLARLANAAVSLE